MIIENERKLLITFGGENANKEYKQKTCIVHVKNEEYEVEETENIPHDRTTVVN